MANGSIMTIERWSDFKTKQKKANQSRTKTNAKHQGIYLHENRCHGKAARHANQ